MQQTLSHLLSETETAPSARIVKLETTDDTLTARAGLAPFVRYLERIAVLPLMGGILGPVKKHAKGVGLGEFLKQMLCFFFDGSSRALSYFDQLAQDPGYAAAIQTPVKRMMSSHVVKRFCQALGLLGAGLWRRILRELFLWRLHVEQPALIEMTLDTMVMDNDEAQQREGATPTYKKVKGFQPLQLLWQGRVGDAIFRPGHVHSNAGDAPRKLIADLVHLIRRRYRAEVPIVLRLDAGFFDQENFTFYDAELRIGFIASGKLLAGVKEKAAAVAPEAWHRFEKAKQVWDWTEFEYGCASWGGKKYRTLYTKPRGEGAGEQILLEFARPENVIVTNLAAGSKVLASWGPELRARYEAGAGIVAGHHGRGADELPHRGLKDFGFEALPFTRFGANRVMYYLMVIGFNLFESYKRDVLKDVVAVGTYATTVRRQLVDLAGKVVRSGRQLVLKVTRWAREQLGLARVWELAGTAPVMVLRTG